MEEVRKSHKALIFAGLSLFPIQSTFVQVPSVDFLRCLTSQLGSTVTAFGAKDITSETLGMDPDLSGDAVATSCMVRCRVGFDMIRWDDERRVCDLPGDWHMFSGHIALDECDNLLAVLWGVVDLTVELLEPSTCCASLPCL